MGLAPPDSGKLQSLSERVAAANQIVKDVMGTGGGENARLASMIHARFDMCVFVFSELFSYLITWIL